MEQIKIIFFALASFFGIEDERLFAEKTTVTVYPEKKEIRIIQEGLFAFIQSESDKMLSLEQWNKITNQNESEILWAKELDSFPVKNFILSNEKNIIQPHLTLKYSNHEDLRALGIWYNEEKNHFSINHIPDDKIKTSDGELNGNYWVFSSGKTFTFTLEPFIQMPENYQKLKTPLNELMPEFKKK